MGVCSSLVTKVSPVGVCSSLVTKVPRRALARLWLHTRVKSLVDSCVSSPVPLDYALMAATGSNSEARGFRARLALAHW